MEPNERDALEAENTGEQLTNHLPQAQQMAEDAAKAAMKAGKATYNAGKNIKELGLKDGAKATINSAAGKVGDKIKNSAPVRAARATQELARIVKDKGAKAGAKQLAKNAGKAAFKAVTTALKKLILMLVVPFISIFALFIIIFANTPAMILSGIGLDSAGEQEQFAENMDLVNAAARMDVVKVAEYLFKKANNWYYEKKEGKLTVQNTDQEVTQEELDKLVQAGDYDGVLSFYTEITQRYLDMAYEDIVNEITSHAYSRAISDGNYNASMTIGTIGANPFTGTDYANIIAAYSTTDDYDTALLSRYKDKLRKAAFITYTLEDKSTTQTTNVYDKDGNIKDTKEETIHWEQVTLIPYSSTDIMSIFGVNPNAIYEKSLPDSNNLTNSDGKVESAITYEQAYSEYYTTLHNKLDELGYVSGGNSVSSASYGTVLTEDEIKKYLNNLPSGTSKNRKQIVKVALDAVGRIPYNNTGQRSYPSYGINPDWGKPSSTNSKHPYKGLDCSGFVQWVYRNAWCSADGSKPEEIYLGLGTSALITSNGNKYVESISKSDLKPGDIGAHTVGAPADGKSNHVGIYLGNGAWIHCSGGGGTVVLSENYDYFSYYYRPTSEAAEKDNYWTEDCFLPFMSAWMSGTAGNLSDDEMTVIATTLHCEFGEDNGFRACAEAVYHYSKYNSKNMYETVQIKNYLDAYTRLYVTHTWNPNERRATSGQLKMLEAVMNGELTHFPNSKYPYPVMYFNTTDVEMTGWRAKGVIAESIPASNGKTVVYFYCKGVTYKGYK